MFLMMFVTSGYCIRKLCCPQLLLENRIERIEQQDNQEKPTTPLIILRCSEQQNFASEFTNTNTTHESCAICIEKYMSDSKIAIIDKCNHMYHEECISEWLRKNPVCPICNT